MISLRIVKFINVFICINNFKLIKKNDLINSTKIFYIVILSQPSNYYKY